MDTPEWITVAKACEIIGGDDPISKANYYRNAAKGIWPRPVSLGPNISRVNATKLRDALTARETAA